MKFELNGGLAPPDWVVYVLGQLDCSDNQLTEWLTTEPDTPCSTALGVDIWLNILKNRDNFDQNAIDKCKI